MGSDLLFCPPSRIIFPPPHNRQGRERYEACCLSVRWSGRGALDVLRYGRMLKARRLVGVRGAGVAYDGLYYVSSVTTIRRGQFRQNFELTRNGLDSITPRC